MRRSRLNAVVVVAVPTFIIATGLCAGVASAEPVALGITSHAVSVDKEGGTATFSVTFDRAPDFDNPADVGEEQPDAFQYEVDVDTTALDRPLGWSDIDSVIRGAEIWEGNGLPVRSRDGDGGGLSSGGWGPLRALLPFEVEGNTVSFTAALSALGDTDGAFRYRLFATNNGEMTAEAVGAVIPLPASVWTGLTMLGGLGIARKVRWIRVR